MSDPDDETPRGFVVIPQQMREAHERHQMEAQDLAARAVGLLDSLSPDQLVALRWILNMDSDSAMNNYWDGQIVAVLRIVHGVDPRGMSPIEALTKGTTDSST